MIDLKPRVRLTPFLLSLVMVAGIWIFLSAAPANAATNGGWSVFPTTLPGHQTRAYFLVALKPDVPYSDSVTIANETSGSLTFNLYAAAAYNTANGAYTAYPRTTPKTGVAQWIHLPVSRVTVEGLHQVNVPFVIVPPANATPGDHFGSIIAENVVGKPQGKGRVRVTVLQAVGSRLYSQVSGPIQRSMQISHIDITSSGGTSELFGGSVNGTVKVSLTNTGNAAISPHLTGTISPLIGSSQVLKPLQMDVVLPGNTVTATLPFKSLDPWGRLSTDIHVTAPSINLRGSASKWVIPWLLLLVIVVPLIIIVLLLVKLRRSRRRTKASRATP